MKLLKAITYARACVYHEAYLAEAKSGGDSKVVAACLVGVFDAPLILSMLLAIDYLSFDGTLVRENFSSNLTSVFSVSFTMFVCLLEYLYFEVFRVGLREKVLLPYNRYVGFGYAVLSLVGGSVMAYFLWGAGDS